ncbi:MAG: Holliday junction resolvase RuvX [Parasporobacterium sp.]|nr:Holliday junction resolvase RuvX [Parasporobacterium sp.]
MRIIGLDYGSRTVGVAVTDGLGITAQPLETITRSGENKLRRTLARIEELAGEYNAELIVLGYPVNMDGSVGERALKTGEFRAMLEKRLNIPVVLQDERLTTEEALEILRDMDVPESDLKLYVDKIAATVILEDYMNSH